MSTATGTVIRNTTTEVRKARGYTNVWLCQVPGCGCCAYTYHLTQAQDDAARHAAAHARTK